MKNNNCDIRDIPSLDGKEIVRLNFIRDSGNYCFRKHNRQGMRSHVLEVLSARDLLKETNGEIVDGIRLYPRATPLYMLRILRTRFTALREALDEIKAYAHVLKYLGAESVALSNEFIVEYTGTGKSEIVLCGLQEYVHGAIFDPWALMGQDPLETFYRSRVPGEEPGGTRTAKGLESIATFVTRMREMITESGYITDLAGNGNLILTSNGDFKLVDINNILKVPGDDTILLDDKGYPSCDKSIEVLWILEDKILQTENLADDPLYKHFLSADRTRKVHNFEKEFFENLSSSSTF